jgi:WD40 repeat protein
MIEANHSAYRYMETIAPTETRTELPFDRHHAFIIGIDEYKQVSPLQTAVNDARKVAEVLAAQQHFLVHEPLLDASGEEIRHLLKTLPEQVGKGDRVLFYFAGHGIAADGDDGPAGYIVPADANPTDVKTFIPMEDLQKQLDALPCRHLLLILDCCFSGAFKWSSQHRAIGTLMPKRIFKERFDRFIEDPAWQVITSAAHDQKALDVLKGTGKPTGDRGLKKAKDDDDTAHSPFALALFEGLKGAADAKVEQEGDGVITATELYAYIRDQIEPATIKESERLRQTPGFFPLRKHDKGEFIFLHPKHRLNLPPIPKRNPYKGLQAFDEADKELFYGRDRVIEEMRAKAESNKLLVISGASGTGKSSVIKAGLLPVLREAGFRILPVIRPGVSPMASLENGFKGAKLIEDSGSLQEQSFMQKLGEQKTVLLIDQYEELITRCPNPEEREQFDALLRKLLDEAPDGALKIILTVRADFEPQLDDGALKNLWMSGRCTVPPFTVEELKEVIVMPTIQEVLIFDPADLVDNIIEEVVQAPGALPLLSYTLSELYEAYIKSGRQDRALKKEDYENLGGVMGALRTKADALYQSLDAGGQNTMRKIMLRMVSLEGELAGKRVPMDELIYADAAENQRVHAVVDQLVEARLIVKGKDYIEPAHDALVRAWKTLREWIHTIGEDKILLNTKVNVAANEYAESQNVKFLWNDNPHLSVLQQDLSKPNQWLNARELDFIQKSVLRKIKRARILRGIVAGVVVALSALTVWALLNAQRANREASRLRADLLAIKANEALATDNTQALRLAEAAYAIVEKAPLASVQKILNNAFHTLYDNTPFYAAKLEHGDAITAVAFSPAQERILTASEDYTARLWDWQGNPLDTLNQGYEKVTLAAFSPSGKIMLTATQAGAVMLWEANGTPRDTIPHEKEIYSAVFSPDEEFILTACADDTARLWNLQGTLIAKLDHNNEVLSAVFDSAGQKILTASADGTAKLWDQQGRFLKTLSQHRKPINQAVFSRDGKMILTASRDGAAELWDAQGNFLRMLPHARDKEVYTAAFSPDGQNIITASADGAAKLWDLQGKLLDSLDHEQKVYSAAFSPDGQNLITASADSTARLWNRQGNLLAIFKHQGEVKQAVFSPDGEHALTASQEGTAKLWNLQDLRIIDFDKPGQFAAFAPNDQRIITVANDFTTRLWNPQGKLLDSLNLDKQIYRAIFSPNGKVILLVSDDDSVRLWNPQEKRLVTGLAHDAHEISSAVFSPDGRQILTVAIDHRTRLWNWPDAVTNGVPPKSFDLAGTMNSAVFSPAGDKILTASDDGYARLWNKDGEPLDSLDHYGEEINLAIFSPTAKQILTAAADGLARVWNDRGKLVDSLQIEKVETAVFSPDGKQALIVDSEGPVKLWNLHAQRSDSLIHPKNVIVTSAVFSPSLRDGQILTAATDGVARLWSLQGELIAELDGHRHKELTVAAFSPDGEKILTAALDNTVKLWWTPQTIFDWLKQAKIARLTEMEKEEFGIKE